MLAAILIALLLAGRSDKAGDSAIAPDSAVETTEVVATVPADGNPDDETCKGTYTVSDEEVIAAKDVVVATVGDAQLTGSELQVYYWSIVNRYLSSDYGYYILMYGALDFEQSLDTQRCYEDQSRTWQQYFLQEALNYWQLSQALSQEAKKIGMELSEEDQQMLAEIEPNMQRIADDLGLPDICNVLPFSAEKGTGRDDLVGLIEAAARGEL